MGTKWFERLYFGFLFLLPLTFCSSIIDSVLLPRQILLTLFLFATAALLIAKKQKLQFNFNNPLIYAIFGFVALNLISFHQATVTGESHAVFSKLAVLFSFFLITAILLYNDVIKVDQLVTGMIVFGLITVSFPIMEIIAKSLKGQHLLRQIEIIKGNSANKNLLSSVLFLCLPFYFIGLKRGTIIRFSSLFGIISTLLVLFTIRTRAVLIATSIFVLLLICYKIKQRFSIKKRYFFGSGIALLALCFCSYLFFFKSKIADLKNPLSDETQKYITRLLDSSTLKDRILFWDNSMLMWHDNIVFGVGLGNWQIQFPKYGLNNFTTPEIVNGETTLQRPHNDFIWILCETGTLGLITYLAIFGLIFYQLYLLIRKATNPNDKWKFYYILAALIGYLIISFFDFPYERIEHQVIIMLAFAIVAAAYLKSFPKKDKSYTIVPLLLLIPIAYSAIVSLYRFSGEQHALKMYAAKANKNATEVIYESKRASSYFYPLDNTTMPLSWYEGIGHFTQNRPDESQACFEKAYQLTPYNIQVLTNLASTNQANGNLDEAIRLFNEALKISKGFDEAKLNLAALYFNQKEFDKAYATINEVKVTSTNPKYKTYLVTILNQKINAYLKTATDKTVVDNLVKNVTTKEALLQLFFDAKAKGIPFETYLAQAKFQ